MRLVDGLGVGDLEVGVVEEKEEDERKDGGYEGEAVACHGGREDELMGVWMEAVEMRRKMGEGWK